ncbi:MAG: methyltransferase [Halanaerobiales bacterium]|nr:methyltransferase [Halanaerobiales bacterium]
MEEKHFLIPDKLEIIQNDDYFKFGTDSVLLANYVKVKNNDKIIDLGSGSGVIPLLLAYKNNPKKVYGLELQKPLVKMSKRSVALNNLEGKIEIIKGDIKNAMEIFEDNEFDTVVTNPPYRPVNNGKVTQNKYKAIARHEIEIDIENIIKNTVRLLKAGGSFYLVHLIKRLPQIIFSLKENKIEPKEMRLIQARKNKAPDRFLLKATLDGNPGFEVENNIVEFKEKTNEYTDEIKKIYGVD